MIFCHFNSPVFHYLEAVDVGFLHHARRAFHLRGRWILSFPGYRLRHGGKEEAGRICARPEDIDARFVTSREKNLWHTDLKSLHSAPIIGTRCTRVLTDPVSWPGHQFSRRAPVRLSF
jgi:hypothetical protein